MPTERLSSDSSTLFLTCHLPYIADGSSNNHAITLNGDVSTKPFAPYDYEEYSATDHGGSVYFDGTGDALRIADNSNIQLGTSSFTIEGWFYCNNTTPTQGILAKRDGSSDCSDKHSTLRSDVTVIKLYIHGVIKVRFT